MAKLREFGLEQRVVARVVHETKVIFKFGIETNRKNVFLKQNRLCIHEIAAGERTDAANGFNQLCPQPGQVSGPRRRFGQRDGFGCRRIFLSRTSRDFRCRFGSWPRTHPALRDSYGGWGGRAALAVLWRGGGGRRRRAPRLVVA